MVTGKNMFHQVLFICFTAVGRDTKHLGFLLIFGQYLQAGWNGFWDFLPLSVFDCSPWSWREAQKAVGYLTVSLRIQVYCVQNWSSLSPAVHGI